MITISAASIAVCDERPVPTAMPQEARTSAGPSLIPSPVIAQFSKRESSAIFSSFSSGVRSAKISSSSRPRSRPTGWATSLRSPVNMNTRPNFFKSSIILGASARSSSLKWKIASSFSILRMVTTSSVRCSRSERPMNTSRKASCTSTSPFTPFPAITCTSLIGRSGAFFNSAKRTIAWAIG